MIEKSSKEVLVNLIKAVRTDNSLCWNVPIDDVANLIFGLLSDCSLIIPKDEIIELEDRTSFIRDKLNEAVTERNTEHFIDYINRALEIIEELPDEKSICEINFSICREHYLDGNSIAIIGDSHINFFSGNEQLHFISIGNEINYSPQILLKYPFTCLHLGPCLAYNSCKEGTNSGFFEKMNYLMNEFLIPGSKVVLSLGEIDLRCHVFKQTGRQNCSYEQIVNSILDNYFIEIDYILKNGFELWVWGPIASQKEDCPKDKYLPRVGSEVQRNEATRYFTIEAEKRCVSRHIKFMSIFDKMCSSSFETNDYYIRSDKCHLSQRALELAKKEWIEKELV